MNTQWIVFVLILFLLLILLAILFFRNRRIRNSTSPYEEALISLIEGDQDNALEKFQQTVFSDSDNIEAYIRLAEILRLKNNASKALQIHKYLLTRKGISKKTRERILFQTAKDYYALSLYQKAADTMTKLLKLNAADEKYYELLLKIYEKTALWNEAVENFRKMSRLFGYSKEQTIRYETYAANEASKKGNYEWALKVLSRVLKIKPDYVPAYIYIGDIEYSNGKPTEAIEKYNRAIEIDARTAHVVLPRLMKAYFDKGEFRKIEDTYKQVLENLPDDKETISSLAEFYIKMGRMKEAYELLSHAIKNSPDSVEINLLLLATKLEDEREGLAKIVHRLIGIYRKEIRYICANCGYKTGEFLIRCPKCNLWETFKISKPF